MSKLFFLKRWLAAPYKRYKTIQMLCPTYRHLVRYLWNFSCDKRIREKERAMLVFRCHAIEKGLSLKNARPGFGVEKMGQLISAVLNYIKHFKDDIEPLSFAMSIIDAYFEFQNQNGFEDEKLKKRYEYLKSQTANLEIPKRLRGGAITVYKQEILSRANISFKDFVMSRHSIRTFTGEPVDVDLLKKAFEIAEYTPSACNRQPWRNYVFTKKEHVEHILTLQTGARQFLHDVGAVIVVTSSATYFYGSEIQQPYLNGGMYSMNLLLSLHSLGLGAIPLNMGLSEDKLKAIKRYGGIADMDIPVLMIAVGVLPESFKVAASCRFPYSDYTFFDIEQK